MSFASDLTQLLPVDLPHRDACIAGAARHLEMIVEANQHFNLTRILNPREAVIKHVLDSVLPWHLFHGAKHVADAGSGAGFPGIPLALVMPDTHFTLLESTQKKAAFIAAAIETLALPNVAAVPERAEAYLAIHPVDIITARAVAPLSRAIPLFAPALRTDCLASARIGRFHFPLSQNGNDLVRSLAFARAGFAIPRQHAPS